MPDLRREAVALTILDKPRDPGLVNLVLSEARRRLDEGRRMHDYRVGLPDSRLYTYQFRRDHTHNMLRIYLVVVHRYAPGRLLDKCIRVGQVNDTPEVRLGRPPRSRSQSKIQDGVRIVRLVRGEYRLVVPDDRNLPWPHPCDQDGNLLAGYRPPAGSYKDLQVFELACRV